MVVGGMVDRLRAAGCVPQLRWIGGLVIACMGGTVDGGGDGDGGGRSVFVSAANDRMDVVGLEAAELEAVARGLIEVGVRLKSGWVEHNGAMELKLAGYPFMRPEEEAHVMPALVSTLSALGFGLESAAGCSALAFVEGAGVRSVAWTMAVAARDMVYGSSGAELGMVLDAVEDAGFAVKKRYKPHKLYQVD